MVKSRSDMADHTPDVDFSVIRTAIEIGGRTIDQILNSIHYGSKEIRHLLMQQCEFIIECKVCRNLFRSVPNFIAHKRVYCQELQQNIENPVPSGSRLDDEETTVIYPESPVKESPPKSEKQVKVTATVVTEADERKEDKQKKVIDKVVDGTFEGKSKNYQFYTSVAKTVEAQKANRTSSTICYTPIPSNPNAFRVSIKTNSTALETSQEDNDKQSSSVSKTQTGHSKLSEEKDLNLRRRQNPNRLSSANDSNNDGTSLKTVAKQTAGNSQKTSGKKKDEISESSAPVHEPRTLRDRSSHTQKDEVTTVTKQTEKGSQKPGPSRSKPSGNSENASQLSQDKISKQENDLSLEVKKKNLSELCKSLTLKASMTSTDGTERKNFGLRERNRKPITPKKKSSQSSDLDEDKMLKEDDSKEADSMTVELGKDAVEKEMEKDKDENIDSRETRLAARAEKLVIEQEDNQWKKFVAIKRIQCVKCNRNFNTLRGLKTHVNMMHVQQLECPKCLQRYSTFMDMRQHFQNDHSLSLSDIEKIEIAMNKNLKYRPAGVPRTTGWKTCEYCDRKFWKNSSYIRHLHKKDGGCHFSNQKIVRKGKQCKFCNLWYSSAEGDKHTSGKCRGRNLRQNLKSGRLISTKPLLKTELKVKSKDTKTESEAVLANPTQMETRRRDLKMKPGEVKSVQENKEVTCSKSVADSSKTQITNQSPNKTNANSLADKSKSPSKETETSSQHGVRSRSLIKDLVGQNRHGTRSRSVSSTRSKEGKDNSSRPHSRNRDESSRPDTRNAGRIPSKVDVKQSPTKLPSARMIRPNRSVEANDETWVGKKAAGGGQSPGKVSSSVHSSRDKVIRHALKQDSDTLVQGKMATSSSKEDLRGSTAGNLKVKDKSVKEQAHSTDIKGDLSEKKTSGFESDSDSQSDFSGFSESDLETDLKLGEEEDNDSWTDCDSDDSDLMEKHARKTSKLIVRSQEEIWVDKKPGMPVVEKARSQKIYVVGTDGSKKAMCLDQKHIDKYVDEVKLKCNTCGMVFTQVSSLRQHVILVHLGWKRYECRKCGFLHYKLFDMKRHLMSVHKNIIRTSENYMTYVIDLNKEGNKQRDKRRMKTYRRNQARGKLQLPVRKVPLKKNTSKFGKPTLHPPVVCHENITTDPDSNSLSNNTKSSLGKKVDRRKPGVSEENIHKPPPVKFNISTRQSAREFDTRPFTQVDTMETLFTRRGHYQKDTDDEKVIQGKGQKALDSKQLSDSPSRKSLGIAVKDSSSLNVKVESAKRQLRRSWDVMQDSRLAKRHKGDNSDSVSGSVTK